MKMLARFARRRPNVLLVTFDALRADHLGCYGYSRKTSPTIDRLAAEGAVFTRAYSQTNWTGGAFATILSATYPDVHKVYDFGCVFDDRLETLSGILRRHGYRTVVFGKEQLMNLPGLSANFDEVHEYNADLSTLAGEVKHALGRFKNRNFFLWVHLYDYPHAPYTAPSPYRERFLEKTTPRPLRLGKGEEFYEVIPEWVAHDGITDANYYVSQYDAEIAYADDFLKLVLDSLSARHMDKDTIVVFSADHGESMGENGLYFQHGNSLAEAEIRVPLIIKAPNRRHCTVSRPIGMLDLTPTLLECVGLNRARLMEGKSLMPFLKNHPKGFRERPIFSRAGILKHTANGDSIKEQTCVIAGDWKCIRSVSEQGAKDYELYNLRTDPRETTDLVRTHPSKLHYCIRIIEGWDKRKKPAVLEDRVPLSQDARSKLKSLGYVQ